MTTTNTLSLTSRRLLILAALSAASLASSQDAPAPSTASDPSPAPVASAAVAAATTDRILPPADPTSPISATLAGVLSGTSTAVPAIQRLDISQREKLFSELSERVQTADRRIAELQQKTGELTPDTQKALEQAVADYNQTKAKLQQSLEGSRATEANTWERSRSSLATDYAFYVAAAAAVELASPNS